MANTSNFTSVTGTAKSMKDKMGMGVLGDRNLIIKRKFRWTWRVDNICSSSGGSSGGENGQGLSGGKSISESWVKIAARPKLSVEETPIHYLNGVMYIPGKGTWQEVTVTYYDVSGNNLDNLFMWLTAVYDFSGNQQISLPQASRWGDYAGNVTLSLYDGCGGLMESWLLQNAWPKEADFGELDYASSDEVLVVLTIRYAWVKLTRYCGGDVPHCACTPCT